MYATTTRGARALGRVARLHNQQAVSAPSLILSVYSEKNLENYTLLCPACRCALHGDSIRYELSTDFGQSPFLLGILDDSLLLEGRVRVGKRYSTLWALAQGLVQDNHDSYDRRHCCFVPWLHGLADFANSSPRVLASVWIMHASVARVKCQSFPKR